MMHNRMLAIGSQLSSGDIDKFGLQLKREFSRSGNELMRSISMTNNARPQVNCNTTAKILKCCIKTIKKTINHQTRCQL